MDVGDAAHFVKISEENVHVALFHSTFLKFNLTWNFSFSSFFFFSDTYLEIVMELTEDTLEDVGSGRGGMGILRSPELTR